MLLTAMQEQQRDRVGSLALLVHVMRGERAETVDLDRTRELGKRCVQRRLGRPQVVPVLPAGDQAFNVLQWDTVIPFFIGLRGSGGKGRKREFLLEDVELGLGDRDAEGLLLGYACCHLCCVLYCSRRSACEMSGKSKM